MVQAWFTMEHYSSYTIKISLHTARHSNILKRGTNVDHFTNSQCTGKWKWMYMTWTCKMWNIQQICRYWISQSFLLDNINFDINSLMGYPLSTLLTHVRLNNWYGVASVFSNVIFLSMFIRIIFLFLSSDFFIAFKV